MDLRYLGLLALTAAFVGAAIAVGWLARGRIEQVRPTVEAQSPEEDVQVKQLLTTPFRRQEVLQLVPPADVLRRTGRIYTFEHEGVRCFVVSGGAISCVVVEP